MEAAKEQKRDPEGNITLVFHLGSQVVHIGSQINSPHLDAAHHYRVDYLQAACIVIVVLLQIGSKRHTWR